MLTKEKLAEAARKEVEQHIKDNPSAWLDDIIAEVADPADTLKLMAATSTNNREMGSAYAVFRQLVNDFAEKAGQSAYDSIIGHPGIT